MNKNILTDITRNILEAWYLDVDYLTELIDKHNLDFDEIYENVECGFWKDFTNINYFIYEALNQIANNFIEFKKDLFKNHSSEFEIYTNYLDSHIYFTDQKVQNIFEDYF